METIEIKGNKVPAEWRDANNIYDVIVSESGCGFPHVASIGGHFICEGVPSEYRPLIIAAPQLFTAAKHFLADISAGNLDPESMKVLADLIEELEMPTIPNIIPDAEKTP